MRLTNLMRFVLLMLLPCMLLGCLEVEEMEVCVVADKERDRLDLCIVSKGIWARGRTPLFGRKEGEEEDLSEELAELIRCRDRGAILLPGLKPLDLTDLDVDIRDEAARQRAEAGRAKLLAHIEVEPGSFTVDADGKLSFVSFLRIQRVTEFLALVNDGVRQAMSEEKGLTDPESIELMRRFLERKEDFVAMDGAGMRARVPLSGKGFDEQRRKFLREVEGEFRSSEGNESPLLESMLENHMAVVRRDGLVEIYMGVQGAKACSYWYRDDHEYRNSLRERLEAKEGALPALDDEGIRASFDEFRGRDVKEPAPLRELRAEIGAKAGGK